MANNTLSPAFVISDIAVRQLDGLFSLNDLHNAAGGAEKHQPNKFIRLDSTQALVAELECCTDLSITPLRTVKGNRADGEQQGTYVCRELVVAYAAWISAPFYLRVIRGFLDHAAAVDQLQQQLHTQGQQLAELRAEKAQRVLAANPRLQQALKYHHIAGLTQAEKACLMGWKTKDSWRNVLKELRTLGLIEDDRSQGRVASGRALHQRQAATQATSLQAPSPARLAAQAANAQKARAAKQAKATTEGGAA